MTQSSTQIVSYTRSIYDDDDNTRRQAIREAIAALKAIGRDDNVKLIELKILKDAK
jgi:hypothetical protein